jgi:hypothetical protein
VIACFGEIQAPTGSDNLRLPSSGIVQKWNCLAGRLFHVFAGATACCWPSVSEWRVA